MGHRAPRASSDIPWALGRSVRVSVKQPLMYIAGDVVLSLI